jgi:hypothetical protein
MNEQIKPVFKCRELLSQHFYERVRDKFTPLPAHRVICYFDDQSVCCEPSERGQFVLLENKNNRICWPDDVRKVMRDASGTLFDALIYVPGSTCCAGDPILFVMAFAHELQHFVQWAGSPKTYTQSKRLSLPVGAGAWDLPHERDAIIASKRVAMDVIGADEVADYTQRQINDGTNSNYWVFFQSLSPSEQYDWVKETEVLTLRIDLNLRN